CWQDVGHDRRGGAAGSVRGIRGRVPRSRAGRLLQCALRPAGLPACSCWGTSPDSACSTPRAARVCMRRSWRPGADVVGLDSSPCMVEIATARVPPATFRVHDLSDPLDWLPDRSVDLALCALAIEYVDDRVAALAELRRVLRPDGSLVLSRQHPTGDWLRHGGSYFEVRTVQESWSRGWQGGDWAGPPGTTRAGIFAARGFLAGPPEPPPGPRARRGPSRE